MELLFFIFVFHNIYISFFFVLSTFFLYLLLMILFATEVRTISLYTFPIKTSVACASFWNFVKIIFFEKILDFFFFITLNCFIIFDINFFSFIYFYILCNNFHYLERVFLMTLLTIEVWIISLSTFPLTSSIASVSLLNFNGRNFLSKNLEFFSLCFIWNFSRSFFIPFYTHCSITVKYFAMLLLMVNYFLVQHIKINH